MTADLQPFEIQVRLSREETSKAIAEAELALAWLKGSSKTAGKFCFDVNNAVHAHARRTLANILVRSAE